MAFWKFIGAVAEEYAPLGLVVQPGYVYDLGTLPAANDLSVQTLPVKWQSSPGPATDFRVRQASDLAGVSAGTVLVGDGVTDNYATLTAMMNGLPFGGRLRIATPTTGNKIAVSQPLIPPKGVTLEADKASTKFYTDESVGVVFVPAAGFVDPVVATDVVGGTINATAGNGAQTLTRTSGNWDTAQFRVGQLIQLVGAAGGAALVPNCHILGISGATMTVSGGNTVGTFAGLTASWGAVVAAVNDYSGLINISADAGTTVAHGILGSGFRVEYTGCRGYGGTLASAKFAGTALATTQQSKVRDLWTENSQNHGTSYQRYYGPYSCVFEQGDMTLTGDIRLISGTKRIGRGAASLLASTVHMTGATNGGPNLELGAPVKFDTLYIDSCDGYGTCLIEHLTGNGNFGFDGGHSDIGNLYAIADSVVTVPLFKENGVANSVRFGTVHLTTTGGLVSCLAQFVNSSNSDTTFEHVRINPNTITSVNALWSGGVPGRAMDISYYDGSTSTVSLDGSDLQSQLASATIALAASADTVIYTSPLVREGTYRVSARSVVSGGTAAVVCEIYVGAGTATISNSPGNTGLLSATAGNPTAVSVDGVIKVTAPGTLTVVLHPGAVTGSPVANKTLGLTGKITPPLTLTKIA